MALAISVNHNVITCIICACGYSCKNQTESHKSCKKIVEKFDPSLATPITRMTLHQVFGRSRSEELGKTMKNHYFTYPLTLIKGNALLGN